MLTASNLKNVFFFAQINATTHVHVNVKEKRDRTRGASTHLLHGDSNFIWQWNFRWNVHYWGYWITLSTDCDVPWLRTCLFPIPSSLHLLSVWCFAISLLRYFDANGNISASHRMCDATKSWGCFSSWHYFHFSVFLMQFITLTFFFCANQTCQCLMIASKLQSCAIRVVKSKRDKKFDERECKNKDFKFSRDNRHPRYWRHHDNCSESKLIDASLTNDERWGKTRFENFSHITSICITN